MFGCESFRPGTPPAKAQALRQFLDPSDFAFALELGPVNPVQLHEPSRDVESLIFRLHFDDGVAADDFLGLGERAIGDRQRPALGADANALGWELQAASF